MADPGDIRVQDEQGNIHVFPSGSTPDMIAKVMNVKVASPEQSQGLWDKVHSFFSDDSLTQQARANYQKERGNLQNPGVSEGAGLREGLAEYDKASGGEMGGGVMDILHGNVAKGLHRIIGGASNAVMPATPLMAPALLASPVATGLGVAGGMAGQKVGQAGAEAMGATPDQAALAGDIGGLAGGFAGASAPKALSRAALLGKTPQEAYQSALKPSTTIPPAKVARMVDTGLQEGIPVSKAGVEKLGSLIDDVNDKIAQTIGAGKGVTIDPAAVAQRADQVRGKFATQVNAQGDLDTISQVKRQFLKEQGARPGSPAKSPQPTGLLDAQGNPIMTSGTPAVAPRPAQPIPAADAQAMKQGTYQQLSSKAYGELKSSSIEAQKALARGLKEELATAFPELKDLNAQDSKLYDLQPILEKAVQREANHQLGGIGTPITAGATKAVTGSNGLAAAAGVVKAIVDNPNVKSRLAIALAKSSGATLPAVNARIAAYSAALAASANNASDENQATQ